jgi:hypothetical protein
MKAKKRKTVASRIIEGLIELAEALERGEALEKRFCVRSIEHKSKTRPSGRTRSSKGFSDVAGKTK